MEHHPAMVEEMLSQYVFFFFFSHGRLGFFFFVFIGLTILGKDLIPYPCPTKYDACCADFDVSFSRPLFAVD